MSKKETYHCDTCDCLLELYAKNFYAIGEKMQVIFTTETTEGRSCKPYFSFQQIDICKDCHDKALDGNYVFAEGAMGYNKYYFKK